MLECYNYSCQGESHKVRGKPCQDCSYSTLLEDGTAIIIICDGHGGDSYFRSDVGARIAVEVTAVALVSFVKNVDPDLFYSKPFIMKEAMSTVKIDTHFTPIDNYFRQLFFAIVSQWRQKVTLHFEETQTNKQKLENVNEQSLGTQEDEWKIWSIYGCTLLAYVQTPNYWFAFQLGDGKCISFHKQPLWKEPIPWDDRCFLNETTSLCDVDAPNEFRYCYEGGENYPIAVFLGSDGMDDSFEDTSALVSFYIGIIKMLVIEGRETTICSIEEDLPQLSVIGSHDDMSLAFVCDMENLRKRISELLQFQINMVKKLIIRQKEESSTEVSNNEDYYRLLGRYDRLMKQWASAVVLDYNLQKEKDEKYGIK